jgi:hypothetical protein
MKAEVFADIFTNNDNKVDNNERSAGTLVYRYLVLYAYFFPKHFAKSSSTSPVNEAKLMEELLGYYAVANSVAD